MKHLDRLLDPRQLADYLKVPVATIYAWRHRGTGPQGFRVGRHLRYRESDIEKWLIDQLAESKQETP